MIILTATVTQVFPGLVWGFSLIWITWWRRHPHRTAAGHSSHTMRPYAAFTPSTAQWCHRGFNGRLAWHHWECCQLKPINLTTCLKCTWAVCVCVICESLLSKLFDCLRPSDCSSLYYCVLWPSVCKTQSLLWCPQRRWWVNNRSKPISR